MKADKGINIYTVGLYFIFFLSIGGGCNAQNSTSSLELSQKVYEQSKYIEDYNTAIYAAHEMLASGQTGWRDTLSTLYYASGNNLPCIYICNQILADNPEKLAIHEVRANCFKNGGDAQSAILAFDSLYSMTNNAIYGYEVATLFYNAGAVENAEKACDALIESDKIEGKSVNISLQDGSYQSVPLKAALYNIKGLAQMAMIKNEEDRKNIIATFDKALEVFPKYVLAKNNKELAARAKIKDQE